MYRVAVGLAVTDRHGRHVCLERNVRLPFTPFLGLELGWVDRNKHDWSGEILAVIWVDETQQFVTELEEWISDDMDLQGMIAALGPEWKMLSKVA